MMMMMSKTTTTTATATAMMRAAVAAAALLVTTAMLATAVGAVQCEVNDTTARPTCNATTTIDVIATVFDVAASSGSFGVTIGVTTTWLGVDMESTYGTGTYASPGDALCQWGGVHWASTTPADNCLTGAELTLASADFATCGFAVTQNATHFTASGLIYWAALQCHADPDPDVTIFQRQYAVVVVWSRTTSAATISTSVVTDGGEVSGSATYAISAAIYANAALTSSITTMSVGTRVYLDAIVTVSDSSAITAALLDVYQSDYADPTNTAGAQYIVQALAPVGPGAVALGGALPNEDGVSWLVSDCNLADACTKFVHVYMNVTNTLASRKRGALASLGSSGTTATTKHTFVQVFVVNQPPPISLEGAAAVGPRCGTLSTLLMLALSPMPAIVAALAAA